MPERYYGLAVVVLLCLGGSALAGRLSATRWGQRVRFGVLYLVVLVVAATAGPLVLDAAAVLGSPSNWALAVPCGLAAAALSVAADRRILATRTRRAAAAPGVPGFGLPTVLACGAVEEINHRGWLPQACLLLPPAAVPPALAGTLVVFALVHTPFGWPHVLAKGLLGGFALAAVLVSGTVLAGVLAHVLFNAEVWQRGTRWT